MKKTARAALLAFLVLCLVLFSAFYQYDDGVIGQFRARATGQQDAQLMQPVQQVVPQEITTGTSERIVYVYGTGMMVRKDSSGITYQHQDYLSSNRFASDANGRLVSKSVQEPYGSNIEEFGASVALQNDYTFTGKEQDDRLYYYGARYYDPQTARFVSVDPIPTSASPYAYAANNPLKFVDPTGAVEWALTQQADTTGVVVLPPDDGMSDVPRWEQGPEPDPYSLQREMARAGQPSIAGTPEGHFVAIETTIGLLTSLGGAGMAKAAPPAGTSRVTMARLNPRLRLRDADRIVSLPLDKEAAILVASEIMYGIKKSETFSGLAPFVYSRTASGEELFYLGRRYYGGQFHGPLVKQEGLDPRESIGGQMFWSFQGELPYMRGGLVSPTSIELQFRTPFRFDLIDPITEHMMLTVNSATEHGAIIKASDFRIINARDHMSIDAENPW